MHYGVVNIDPEILGGTPVFNGTRVPVQTLFDYVRGGSDLEEFLDDFPTVTRDQAIQLIETAKKWLTTERLLNENSA